MAKFRTVSGLVDVTPYMRTASGLVACTAVFYTTSGPVTGGGDMTADVSSRDADGSVYRKTNITVTTATVTASATGGTTPYSYSWVIDDSGWKITNQNAATTAFQSPPLAAGASADTVARCIIIGGNSTATTPDVNVAASNNYESLN